MPNHKEALRNIINRGLKEIQKYSNESRGYSKFTCVEYISYDIGDIVHYIKDKNLRDDPCIQNLKKELRYIANGTQKVKNEYSDKIGPEPCLELAQEGVDYLKELSG